ncbi:MAG: CBS domain-containing protein [Eubacteriales bacterium]
MNVAFFLTPKSRVGYLEYDDTFRQCLEKMRHHGYTAIPVIDKAGKYVGTLSEGDLLWSIIDVGGADLRDCEELRIANILKPEKYPPVKITAKIEELVDLLLSQNFVPVVDDRGSFMGIITRKTVLDYLNKKVNN